jgi:hypothetical protein
MTSYIERTASCTMFAGRAAVSVFQALSLASGMDLYAKTGMRPNRAWTPTAMLRTAGSMTDKTYKRGQYAQASADLRAMVSKLRDDSVVVR